MKKRFSCAVFVLALLFLCAVLLSAVEIGFLAEHDCAGEFCEICTRISACVRLFSELVGTLTLLCFVSFVCGEKRGAPLCHPVSRFRSTPVFLKVKLSD